MGLRKYKEKRDFSHTPEPHGKEKKSRGKGLIFVVQKHQASRLHYDFRLEHNGVLVSWAIPKGPSLDPDDKRLAVLVEDHPFDYKDFEGVIPEGQYGAGEVIIWDSGLYVPESDGEEAVTRKQAESIIEEGLRKGKLSLQISGEKMHGSWSLVKMKNSEKNWLLLKHDDNFADKKSKLVDLEESVKSGKTINDLQKTENDYPVKPTKAKRKNSNRAARGINKRSSARHSSKNSNKRSAASKRVHFPAQVSPMLAYLVDAPFSREGWMFEPKFDGIRAIAYVQNGNVKLLSRRGLDLTGRYPLLIESLAKMNDNVVLDGEIVAFDKTGKPSFQLLQQRSGLSLESDVKRAEKGIPIQYYAFDILQANGEKLYDLPLKQRKEILKKVLKQDKQVRIVDGITDDGEKAFMACVENGLEGVIAKKSDSIYEAGRRSRNWLKIKSTQSNEFVVCGYTEGTGSRSKYFGALILGYYDTQGNLVYAGSVGTGFNNKSLAELRKAMKPLETSKSPLDIAPRMKATWLRPKLVAEVKYAEWTRDKKLRVPVFLHLREDIDPKKTRLPKLIASETVPDANDKHRSSDPQPVIDDHSVSIENEKKSPKGDDFGNLQKQIKFVLDALKESVNQLQFELQGYKMSFGNLNKVMWPAVGKKTPETTKRDFLEYLCDVAPVLLWHLKNRPLTLIRYPNGVHGKHFFQKHWEHDLPEFVETVRYFSEEGGKDETYLLCNNFPSLLWLGQLAVLELHTVHSRIDPEPDAMRTSTKFTGSVENIEGSLLNFPDYAILDLDPYIYSGREEAGTDPQLSIKGFRKTCEIALEIKELLDKLGLNSFVKTSGKTGLHIYVPVVRNLNNDDIRAFAATIARYVLIKNPKYVSTEWSKKKRTGKIFFDYNMNARGKTLPSVYSPRSADFPTVSCPIDWDELTSIYPTDFTLKTVPQRIKKFGDLWDDLLRSKQDMRQVLADEKGDLKLQRTAKGRR